MTDNLSEKQLKEYIKQINEMSQIEMARSLRFSKCGTVFFSNPILWKAFSDRFNSLGGWTPEISKLIGW